jgi:hypothetical protein
MPFNPTAFMKAEFRPRTADIPVKSLADFFDEGEEPVWKVRGLTGEEVARTREIDAKMKRMTALAEAFEAASKSEIVAELKQSFGIGNDTPLDFNKRVDQIVYGSVDPEVTQEQVVKLARVAPIEFYTISQRILELTGLGQEAEKKRPPSGENRASS